MGPQNISWTQESDKNDFVSLYNTEITAKQVIQGYTKIKSYKLNKKNAEDTTMKIISFIGFGVWRGGKRSKKNNGFESNLLSREIMLKVQEEKRRAILKLSQLKNVFYVNKPKMSRKTKILCLHRNTSLTKTSTKIEKVM